MYNIIIISIYLLLLFVLLINFFFYELDLTKVLNYYQNERLEN